MEHEGHRERLRQRFQQEGLNGFAPHEILELLLTFSIPRINVNPLAHRLMNQFGSLHAVLEASPEELRQVDGIGEKTAALISLMLPLFRQYEQDALKPKLSIQNYSSLTAYCRSLFLGVMEERAYVLCFDTRLRLLGTELLSEGTPGEVIVMPRMVVQAIMRRNASGAVLTHNHPSGNPQPSQEDVDLTESIFGVLDSMKIRLYDHVIIAGQENFSFHQNGLLPSLSSQASLPMTADRPQRKLPPRKKK